MDNELLDAALVYAEKMGWKIHPCNTDKTPKLKDWPHQATSDPDKIKEWWAQWPDASIGCKTGPDSKIWVLDIDLPDGPGSLKKLQDKHGPLPATLTQKTGSGGQQIFFSYNGTNIRNSANKAGKKIDVRGDGGFVIVAPSGHPSGGKYEWTQKKAISYAPDWLVDIVKKNDVPIFNHTNNSGNTQYGLAALAQEIIKLSGLGPGQRNDQLNTSAYSLGQLIAGGELEIGYVENSLFGLALSVGLGEQEAKKTLKSGLNSGIQVPRSAPETENSDYYFKKDVSGVSNVSGCKQVSADVSNTPKDVSKTSLCVSKCKQDTPQKTLDTDQSLMSLIEQYIINSNGSFTTRDIDFEFGLKTRKEKNARSRALSYMDSKKKLINKDRAVAGKWNIVQSNIEWVDLDAEEEEKFDIALPFNLHDHVVICPHSIIVIAGTGDAGKTTFILNTLKLNRGKKYPKHYLMSEMAPGEYKMKLRRFCEPLENWKCIKAAQRSYDFNGVIQHHNQNGLTCIDYLEDISGEYYKITSSIREIYDALGDGVAVVAIQKDSKSVYARGGEGTMEKSRLYLTIDYLATVPKGVICAIKILKVKNFLGDNYKNHELHFKIHGKNEMTVLMDWTPSHKVDRQKCTIEYERGFDFPDSSGDSIDPIYFSPFNDKSQPFRVREQTIVQWGANYTNIEDIYEEVMKLSKQHRKKPFVKNFVHLSAIMADINKKRGQ